MVDSFKTICAIRDSDFGLENGDANQYIERLAARAVLVDENGRIGMIEATKYGYYKLPGGGVDEGESIEQALKREVAEEIGYEFKMLAKLGVIREERREFSQVNLSYGFLCKASKFIGTSLMPDEIDHGFRTKWFNDLDEAITAVELVKDSQNIYQVKFFTQRELEFLREARKYL